jgi:hypothetical protein
MANITQQEQERLKLLQEIELIEKRINAQNEKAAISKSKEAKRLKAQLDEEKKQLDKFKEQLGVVEKILKAETKRKETAQKRRELQEEAAKYEDDQLKSITKLSPEVKSLLNDQVTKTGVVSDITARIIKLKRQETSIITTNDGKQIKASAEQIASYKLEREQLEKQKDLLIDSATNSAFAKMTDDQKEAAKIQADTNGMSEFGIKLYMNAYKQRKLFAAQEKRIGEIQEQQKKMYDAIPEGLKSIIEGAGKFLKVSSGVVLLWAVVASVFALGVKAMTDMSDASKKFKQETGIINSQMKDVKKTAAAVTSEMAQLGVEFEGVFETISEIKKQFGDVANLSKDTVRALTVLSTNFGVAAEDSAEFVGQLEAMTGLSEDTAVNYALQVTNVAKLSKIAPKQLFKDIAEAAKDSAEYFGTGFDNMAKTAIEARRLGSTLKEVMGVSEKLLDFEGGIEQELKAAAFAQGQFNLTQARTLAANKDYSGALDEVLNQMERNGRFADKDLFTQRELAKTVGSTPATIQRLIAQRERLVHLGDEDKKLAQQAIANGLDIVNTSKEDLDLTIQKLKADQQMQGELSKIKNTFTGIGVQIGTAVLPLLELMLKPISMMASVFGYISSTMAGMVGFGVTLAGIFAYIYRTKLKTLATDIASSYAKRKEAGASVAGAIASIFGGQGKLPIVGAILAATMVGALFAALSKASSAVPAGDMNSPASGQTTVSTKEGGLFKLSKNDDLIAAPGASSALANASNAGGGGAMQGIMAGIIQANTKAMERLSSGGIPVNTYLDTSKVTSNINGYQTKTTRNNFNI